MKKGYQTVPDNKLLNNNQQTTRKKPIRYGKYTIADKKGENGTNTFYLLKLKFEIKTIHSSCMISSLKASDEV